MKKYLLYVMLVGLMACSFPAIQLAVRPTPTPPPPATETPTIAPTPQLGTEANPLIFALSPSAHPAQDMITAGEKLAAQLQSLTGYTVVTVAPNSEADLVEALGKNNAHIVVLSPFAYLLARQDGLISVALASLKSGEPLYGAQFIANRRSEFKSYYDELLADNTADAKQALHQFDSKKPCWSDVASPSGYVIPLGFLNDVKVQTRPAAFLAGQPTVVRAVYAEDICDFGATFVDARLSPALEADYPDTLEKVVVIWRIPAVIPYDNVSFSIHMPVEMRRVLLRAFVDLMNTPEGRSAMQTVYGIDALEPADEGLYAQFEKYSKASGVDLLSLLN